MKYNKPFMKLTQGQAGWKNGNFSLFAFKVFTDGMSIFMSCTNRKKIDFWLRQSEVNHKQQNAAENVIAETRQTKLKWK